MLVVGLDHVSRTADEEEVVRVGDGEQRVEPAQVPVHPPVLGELDDRLRHVGRIALELLLELLEERERVGDRPREAGEERPSPSTRTLRALPFTTVSPMVT